MKKTSFWGGAEAVGWKRFRAVTFIRLELSVPRMKTFDFPHESIPHTIKDPYSKALEPDCLCPRASDYDTASSGGGPGWGWAECLQFHPDAKGILVRKLAAGKSFSVCFSCLPLSTLLFID